MISSIEGDRIKIAERGEGMQGLPFLPGNTFNDPTKTRFHLSHSLGFKNGLAIQPYPKCAVGGMPLPFNNLSEEEMRVLADYKPTLTYGQAKQAPPEAFVPAAVALDKKVLRFNAYLKETVYESPNENYRVRHMDFYYFLEDDSIKIEEHFAENRGIPHGIFLKRQRIPKNDVGECYNWRDLNNGVNVTVYGKVFHLYACDKFTMDWLESKGIVVNDFETAPEDPYLKGRWNNEVKRKHMYKVPSDFDQLRQFVEMDRRVLRYYAVWDDRDVMFGEMRKFVILYYLSDDTMVVNEVKERNSGRDPFSCLIRRHRFPKDRYAVDPSFPIAAMEPGSTEYSGYITPVDLKIGSTVVIYNRRFLIYDIDNFTRAFYWKNFGQTNFTPVDIRVPVPELPKKEIPPHNFHGSMDDSMGNVLRVSEPLRARTDVIKYMENQTKVLRYEMFMDSTRHEDRCRRFIMSYRLSNDTIEIYEPPIRNSGFGGGKYLTNTRVAKPGTTPDRPKYYGPADFYIGALIEVFRHRFIITNADHYVLSYMETHPNDFPEKTVQSLRDKLQIFGKMADEGGESEQSYRLEVPKTDIPEELSEQVSELKHCLKRILIDDNNRLRSEAFPSWSNLEKLRFTDKKGIYELCTRYALPVNDDIINCLVHQMAKDPDHISSEQLLCYLMTGDQEVE